MPAERARPSSSSMTAARRSAARPPPDQRKPVGREHSIPLTYTVVGSAIPISRATRASSSTLAAASPLASAAWNRSGGAPALAAQPENASRVGEAEDDD